MSRLNVDAAPLIASMNASMLNSGSAIPSKKPTMFCTVPIKSATVVPSSPSKKPTMSSTTPRKPPTVFPSRPSKNATMSARTPKKSPNGPLTAPSTAPTRFDTASMNSSMPVPASDMNHDMTVFSTDRNGSRIPSPKPRKNSITV